MRTLILVMLAITTTPSFALEADEVVGFWRSASDNIIEISIENGAAVGKLHTVDATLNNWPFKSGDFVWTNFRFDGDTVRFDRLVAASRVDARRVCPTAKTEFTGKLVNKNLTGLSKAVRFDIEVDENSVPKNCTANIGGNPLVYEYSPVEKPACCLEISFACADSDDENRCIPMEAAARNDCLAGGTFFSSFSTAKAAESVGGYYDRTLSVWVANASMGIVGFKDGDQWVFGQTSRRISPFGREIWDSASIRPLTDEDLQTLSFLAVADGEFLNVFRRVWTRSKDMGKTYLDNKFDVMVNSCQMSNALMVSDPTLAGILKGYFEVTGLPPIADDVDAVRELGAAALDPNIPTGQRALAAALIAGVLVGEAFDIPAVRKWARDMLPALKKQSKQLADESADLGKKLDQLDAESPEAKQLAKQKAEVDASLKEIDTRIKDGEEFTRALGEAHAPRRFTDKAPDYDPDDWVPGTTFRMGKLAEAYEDQGNLIRQELRRLEGTNGNPGSIRKLETEAQRHPVGSELRDEWDARLAKAKDQRRLNRKNLAELEQVLEDIRKHGIRPKLEGIVGRQDVPRLRETMLDPDANRFTKTLVSEELGERASRQYLEEAFGGSKLSNGFGTQLHGPDWGTSVKREGDDVLILVEAKSRMDAFAQGQAPITPEDLLKKRKRSNATQHSPADTKYFANKMADIAEDWEDEINRRLNDPRISLAEEDALLAQRGYYQEKQEYWRTVADNVDDRTKVELHTVIYDPRTNEMRAWIWDGQSWVQRKVKKSQLALD